MSTLKAHTIEPVTGTTLTLGAAGDALTVSSASLQTNIYKDAGANTLFQSDGAGTLSNVNAGLQGAGPVLITTQTVIAPAVTSVDFTSGITSAYKKYWFVVEGFTTSGNSGSLYFNASTDAGSTWTVNMYSTFGRVYQYESNGGDGMGYMSGSDVAGGYPACLGWELGIQSDDACSGILELYDPASTSYVKQFISRTSGVEYNVGLTQGFVSGYIDTTSAITGIQLKTNNGMNVTGGTFKMYGIV